MPFIPPRKRPAKALALPIGVPHIISLTVCSQNRERWLASEKAHDALKAAWLQADAWLVGKYVLMPDHLHLFCAPVDDVALEQWVAYWKRLFTQTAKCPKWRWQSGQWNTRLRKEEGYAETWEYIRENPVRAGLVIKPEDWPHQGELNELRL